jgi:CHAD domain-containing protein
MVKWLPDVSPGDRAVDVAARTLAVRLDAVRRYLKRAARTRDPEDVHQLRVWSRRADAALDLFADLLPRDQLRWFREWTRRLRRAAGRARDADVLARHVAEPGATGPALFSADRRRGLKKIRALARRLNGGRRLKRRTRKMLDRMGRKNAVPAMRFGELARARLTPAVAEFFDAAPTRGADDPALHRFRIRGKRLRYAIELFAGAFPPALRDELYPQVAALQERLGRVNDLATAQARLGKWLADTGDPATVSHLRRRLTAVGEELVRARAEFWGWWTPELRDGLRGRFGQVLGQPVAAR